MSKSLTEILYNPSSINSVGNQEIDFDYYDQNNKDHWELISNLIHEIQLNDLVERSIYNKMVQIKRHLISGISLESRIIFCKEYSGLVRYLASKYNHSAEIFQACLKTTVLLKELVDQRPQKQGQLSQQEWVELEKLIYILSNWESQIKFFWSAAQ